MSEIDDIRREQEQERRARATERAAKRAAGEATEPIVPVDQAGLAQSKRAAGAALGLGIGGIFGLFASFALFFVFGGMAIPALSALPTFGGAALGAGIGWWIAGKSPPQLPGAVPAAPGAVPLLDHTADLPMALRQAYSGAIQAIEDRTDLDGERSGELRATLEQGLAEHRRFEQSRLRLQQIIDRAPAGDGDALGPQLDRARSTLATIKASQAAFLSSCEQLQLVLLDSSAPEGHAAAALRLAVSDLGAQDAAQRELEALLAADEPAPVSAEEAAAAPTKARPQATSE